jgi:hypothetical protein
MEWNSFKIDQFGIVEIPDHVDPPFRFMLTHHSGMMTHPLFYNLV